MESVLLYGVEVWGHCIVRSGHLNRYRSEQPGLWGGSIGQRHPIVALQYEMPLIWEARSVARERGVGEVNGRVR